MFVCLFYTFQKSFCPAQDERELMQGFLLHEFSSSIKSRLNPTLLYFVLCFSGKKVMRKNQKKISLIILKTA